MSPLPSLYLETIQRASYIIVQRYSNIQSEAIGRTFHPQKQSESKLRALANRNNSNAKAVSLYTI